ncbi:DNA-binding transcriptional regulator, MarR family [Terribacillus saccharophilus]|uniref:DNA-binding transcriptional regulator, MarR family n=1 Tax=Terribacillus saccharophilus TaxID=361277 RepID=A0AAX2EC80_9BACI|nr:helix-turn-helix domain-containing GNAT family N-acetyltransferase [Terribacillus saccharophilus]MEC0290268.1 helix-turn-helix domain-containing GNAT family N-acetyltransferase [Terribacillus saccharophilus]SEM67330.1 DNA-binding transcriptional regulator, MarR family [Terribacillus saccharophilus]
MKRMHYLDEIRAFNRYYANVLGKIDQEIYNPSLPLTEARVVTEVHMNSGCTATEIREKLGIDRGYMSRIVQQLENEDILKKEQSTKDKRQYALYLTNHGEKIYTDLAEKGRRGIEKISENIPDKELSHLVAAMETIQSINSKTYGEKEVVIRPFQPGDAGFVAQLHGEFYKQEYNFGSIFEYYVLKGISEFILDIDGSQLWIAEVDGEKVGSIAVGKTSDSIAQIKWFILNENSQGLGLGKRLMNTAMNFCKESGYKHVYLWTFSKLVAARHLYNKFGFTLTEEKPNEEWSDKKERIIEERWDIDLTVTELVTVQ